MNSKYFAILLLVFGVLFALVQSTRINSRVDADSDSAGSDDSDGDAVKDEGRAIDSFLQNEDDANDFLDHSRRLFGDQKSHMKEAKKAYEEKCERLLHPRYCPDLTTWPAWNQAWNSATGKK